MLSNNNIELHSFTLWWLHYSVDIQPTLRGIGNGKYYSRYTSCSQIDALAHSLTTVRQVVFYLTVFSAVSFCMVLIFVIVDE